jgi:hypothetical protein
MEEEEEIDLVGLRDGSSASMRTRPGSAELKESILGRNNGGAPSPSTLETPSAPPFSNPTLNQPAEKHPIKV